MRKMTVMRYFQFILPVIVLLCIGTESSDLQDQIKKQLKKKKINANIKKKVQTKTKTATTKTKTNNQAVHKNASNKNGKEKLYFQKIPIPKQEYEIHNSYPVFNRTVSTNYPWLPYKTKAKKFQKMPIQPLGNRQGYYESQIDGCRAHYLHMDANACDDSEDERFDQNIHQPPSVVNYTKLGFAKMKIPERAYKLLKDYYNTHKDSSDPEINEVEEWAVGNTYTNHWETPTQMVWTTPELEDQIIRQLHPVAEAFANGTPLKFSAVYGIRIYKRGNILATHVDRNTLVIGMFLNIAQENIQEDWPLQVLGHDNNVYNVTMQPGEMILCETHSALHGRPFPLKGDYYANFFLHYEPRETRPHSALPIYIMENSTWVSRWMADYQTSLEPTKHEEPIPKSSKHPNKIDPLHAAAKGHVHTLRETIKNNPNHLHQKDRNGWKAIHEGARGGHVQVVDLLVNTFRSDINERTQDGKGGTPLYYAEQNNPKNHPILHLMRSLGAISIGPEL